MAAARRSNTGITGPRIKPQKPRPDFPFTPHPNGQWCKKIKGNLIMFGVWEDPGAAEALYQQEREDWEAGRNPRLMPVRPGQIHDLTELADRWLVMRRSLLIAADPHERISPGTYKGSKAAMDKLCEFMGKHSDPMNWLPEDFHQLRIRLGAGVSPATKGQRIMYIRAMFNWNVKQHHLPHLPDYGDEFDGVSTGEKEEYRYDFQKEHGERRFELADARSILQAWDHAVNATPGSWGKNEGGWGSHAEMKLVMGSRVQRACNYLAANTGANSKDIALLTFADVDLNAGYLERKRSKTAVLWQATLWPETVSAIRQYHEVRPQPARPEWSDCVFLTAEGYPVNHGEATIDEKGQSVNDNRSDALRQACSKLLTELGIKAPGVTFGAWRHTFRSIAADALGVQSWDVGRIDAINRIMAHRIPGMANRYVKLRPEQLRPITDAVRAQLWPDKAGKSGGQYLRLVS